MKYLATTSMITAVIWAAGTPAAAQGFDCRYAKLAAERTVCASRTLRRMDQEIAIQYRNVRRQLRSERVSQAFIREQRAWLRSRNNCRRDRACLDTMYRVRLAELDRQVEPRARYNGFHRNRKPQYVSNVNRCNIRGYSIDRDPSGLNVRSGPGKRFGITARLRGRKEVGNYIHPEIEITGVQGNWLRIRHARLGIDGRTLFKGVGWVNANLVATSTRAPYSEHTRLRRNRAQSSRTVALLPADIEVRLRGCRGRWAQVAYQGRRGWLAPGHHCGTAQTSCN